MGSSYVVSMVYIKKYIDLKYAISLFIISFMSILLATLTNSSSLVITSGLWIGIIPIIYKLRRTSSSLFAALLISAHITLIPVVLMHVVIILIDNSKQLEILTNHTTLFILLIPIFVTMFLYIISVSLSRTLITNYFIFPKK